ncbi:MAG: hotdog family protein [Aeromonas sp.]|nr:hotdog family protein [Aeromonas sp.]
MSYPAIASLVPHAAPMLLLDRLCEATATTARCEVRVGETLALFLRDDGALPGWVGIELMAQTVAAWSGYQGHQRQEEPQIGLLLGARKYQCHLARLPAGSLLTIDCEQLLQDGALASFQCYLRCDGELVAEARLSTIQPDAEQLETLLGSRQA